MKFVPLKLICENKYFLSSHHTFIVTTAMLDISEYSIFMGSPPSLSNQKIPHGAWEILVASFEIDFCKMEQFVYKV